MKWLTFRVGRLGTSKANYKFKEFFFLLLRCPASHVPIRPMVFNHAIFMQIFTGETVPNNKVKIYNKDKNKGIKVLEK
jgi:hypothetical protein